MIITDVARENVKKKTYMSTVLFHVDFVTRTILHLLLRLIIEKDIIVLGLRRDHILELINTVSRSKKVRR